MAELRKRSEDRQVELVDAAVRLIGTKGIAALSTRNLADAVGLSTGAIFKHFASLDDLLDAVVVRIETLLELSYSPLTVPPLVRLQKFVEARSRAAGGRLGLHRLVTSEQFHLALPDASAKRLRKAVQKSRGYILECLRDGQRAGTVRDDVDALAMVPIVMGTIQALALAGGPPSHEGIDVEPASHALVRLLEPPTKRGK
ncbi:MAG: TetR/AcrR family transcriptional regulator [Polyangiaceae bacterium]